MKMLIFLSLYLTFAISVSEIQASDYAIVCGKINNCNEVLELRLANTLLICPNTIIKFHTDSTGSFHVSFPVFGLTELYLKDQFHFGIPIYIDKGDSIHLEYERSNRIFPDYLENIQFTGRYNTDQNPYLLFKNNLLAQDSVNYYKKKLSPSDFLNYCFNELKIEEERLMKDFQSKKNTTFFIKFNKIFWLNQIFLYTIPSNPIKESHESYFKHLDSLGFFNFIDTLTIKNDDIVFCFGFSRLMQNIYNDSWINGDLNSGNSSDIEILDAIKNDYTGIIQQGLLAYNIYRYMKFESQDDGKEIIDRYITNKKLNEALSMENSKKRK